MQLQVKLALGDFVHFNDGAADSDYETAVKKYEKAAALAG